MYMPTWAKGTLRPRKLYILDVSNDKIFRPLLNTFWLCVTVLLAPLRDGERIWKDGIGGRYIQEKGGRNGICWTQERYNKSYFYCIKIAKYCAKEFKSYNEWLQFFITQKCTISDIQGKIISHTWLLFIIIRSKTQW